MRGWRRLVAAFMTLAMLLPMAAIGEEAPMNVLNPELIQSENQEPVVPESESLELGESGPEGDTGLIALEEEIDSGDIPSDDAQGPKIPEEETASVDMPSEPAPIRYSGDINPDDEIPTPQNYEDSITEDTHYDLNVGDTLKLYVGLEGVAATKWASSKKKVASVTFREGDAYALVTPQSAGETKLTATLNNKQKIVASVSVTDPYLPTQLKFSQTTFSIPAGGSADLSQLLVVEPEYIRDRLTWKASGKSAVVDNSGKVTTTKSGKVKITVSLANNKKIKTVLSLSILKNVQKNMNPKPSPAAVSAISSTPAWTLWPVSIEVAKKGLNCQFYVLNNTGEKSTQIENLDIGIATGSRSNEVARGHFAKIKAACAIGKFKAIKLTLPITGDMSDAFFPEHFQNGTLYFDINQDSVALKSKTGSFGFVPNDRLPEGPEDEDPTADFEMADGVVTGYTGAGGAITIPNADREGNTIVAIGKRAFAGHTSITRVNLHRNIERIESEAFTGCTGLTRIVIPASVEDIAPDAFDSGAVLACTLDSFAYAFAYEHGYETDILGNFELTGIRMEGNSVVASVVNSSTCYLNVQLLTDDQSEVLFDTERIIGDSATDQDVAFNIDGVIAIPEHCALKAQLKDSFGREIGEPLVSLEHTEAREIFASKTPEDFPNNTVLDFHDDGFIVLEQQVVTVTGEATDRGYIVSTDQQLHTGSTLYVKNLNMLVKAASVSQSGGSYVIVPDENAGLLDFYQYMRFDGTFDAVQSLANQGDIAANTISHSEDLARFPKHYSKGAFSADCSIGVSVTLKTNIDKALLSDEMFVEAYATVDGSAVYTIAKDFDLSKLAKAYDLSDAIPVFDGLIATPIPMLFVSVDVNIPVSFTAEGSVTFSTNFEGKMGFRYDKDTGMQKIRETNFSQTLNAGAKITASVGPEVDVGISAGGMLTASIGAQIGAELTAETTLLDIDFVNEAEKKHKCHLCFDVDVNKFVNLNAKLTAKLLFAEEELASKTWPVHSSPIFSGYLSVLNDPDSVHKGKVVLAEGKCPNYTYRVRVKTLDEDGNVTGPKNVIIYRKENGGKTVVASGMSEFKAYLYPGNYQAVADYDGQTATQDFRITESPMTVNIRPNAKGILKGHVTDATTGSALSGATVSCGDYSTTTDASGDYTLELPAESYTVTISKHDYISHTFDVIIEGDQTITHHASLSKQLDGMVRVVLTWGEIPRDLDSHLEWAGGHVYWYDQQGHNAMLDVDDTTSYGPETVTFVPDQDVTYTYYVHDYTNQDTPTSRELGASGATVDIYLSDGTHVTRYVPSGTGTRWVVFTYRNGEIRYMNAVSNVSANGDEASMPEKPYA